MTLTIFSALYALSGCTSGSKCDTGDSSASCGDSGGDADTDTDTDTDLSFNVSWTSSGVTLGVTHGTNSTYLFGLAEESDLGWLGEDGYDGPAGEGRGGNYDINHTAMSDGAQLTTVHDDADLVIANSTTLITNTIDQAGTVGYMLDDGTDCWRSNDSDNYYSDCN